MQKKQAGNNRIYHSAIVCLFLSFLSITKELFYTICLNFVQMLSELPFLYVSMKIFYVLSYRHKHAFSIYIRLSSTQELSELLILFP